VSDPIRAFLAVPLSPEARAVAQQATQRLRETAPGVRWIDASQLHLTLKFLEALASAEVPRLIAEVSGRLRGETPFEVGLCGFGAFPDARHARVVWMGVDRGQGALARLARKLDRAASRLGVPRDPRPYHAHLTLGRLREPRALALDRAAAPPRVSFRVEEVVLYESRLASNGATHLPLARLPLGSALESSDIDFAPEP
jgi:2'-5' RNA ligase